MKVVIIGSGIAGLSAAIALRSAGATVIVYERAPELTEVGAGISLWSNALRGLDTIGAGAAVRQRIEPLLEAEFRGTNGHVIAALFPASRLEHALGHQPVIGMIHRAELVESLAQCIPHEVVRYGFELAAVQDSPDQVTVEFTNGHRDSADLVIGADGIHSKVRSLLYGDAPPRYAGYTCFRGVTDLPSSIRPGHLAEWWGRGCRVGITTLRHGRAYWWATVNAPQNLRIEAKQRWLLDQFNSWAAPVPELIASTPESAIHQNDIIDRRPDNRWYRGRCLLIGDAAHPTTPNLGQGGGLAIEDAACLLHLFAQALPLDKLLPTFVALRYDRATTINRDSNRVGRTGQWSSHVACRIRDGVARQVLPLFGVNELIKHAGNVGRFMVD
jgi:2-polyprenyl-6-methoxyphenol hydroxylase-like FAD-dependent oxidoreductase